LQPSDVAIKRTQGHGLCGRKVFRPVQLMVTECFKQSKKAVGAIHMKDMPKKRRMRNALAKKLSGVRPLISYRFEIRQPETSVA
jgi:hypothetical protein